MTAPLRRLTAVLALLALTLSVVEKGWAAACVTPPSVPAASSGEGAHGDHLSSSSEQGSGNEDRGGSERPAPCPMAIASGMACGVVAVGASPSPALVTYALSKDPLSRSDLSIATGALSSLFRPPQQ